MILISHRGNLNGKNVQRENTEQYINLALDQGFDVEIDVWFLENKWFLGHDNPESETSWDFLNNAKFWIHAKNGDALNMLTHLGLLNKELKFFWHQNDEYTLTSNNILWTFPNKKLFSNSVCVLPELGINGEINNIKGICSDYISEYSYKIKFSE